MAQRAFSLPQARPEYALGRKYGEIVSWVGVAKGFTNALAATTFAQRVLADSRVSACPIRALTPSQKALARAGQVVEAPCAL